MADHICTHTTALRRDPTRTTTLRQRFEQEAGRRFRRLKGRIRKELVDLDGFGLRTNRGRFEFTRSDRKVAEFMAWLAQAQQEEILGVFSGMPVDRAAQNAWTSLYIQTAYQRGLAQAAANLRGAGATVSDRWVESAFFRPIHADRLGLAYTRAYTELEGITQAMDQQISRVLAMGLADGSGPEAIARLINDRVDKIGRTRARVLARTEVISAHAEASINAYEEAGIEGVLVEAEWLTAVDACPLCVTAAAGGPYALEDARGMIPLHPNCLPGDALVLSRSPIAGVSKRVFNGDMIVIKTASGLSLSCTPNHPVLTDSGWTAAQDINLSSQVVCDGGSEWESLRVNGDDDNVISSIHDVAESFFGSGEVEAMPVPTAAEHFHGDGIDGEIAVIGTDSSLSVGRYASFNQAKLNESLKRRGATLSAFFTFGAIRKVFNRALCASDRIMRSAHLVLSLGLRHLLPFQCLRFGPAANTNTGVGQYSPNGGAIEPEAVSNGLFRFAGSVSEDDIVCPHGHKLRPGSVSVAEQADDDFIRDAMLARKLLSGDAGPVFFDKVVSVDKIAFSGHVYNLETVDNWYSANGIITHNCRCSFAPLVVNGTGIELR